MNRPDSGPSSCQLTAALGSVAPVTLDEMAAAALMDRSETKYLLPLSALPALLTALAGEYRVLTMDGERQLPYRSLYLDTPDFDFYHAHHNGRARRHKVRFRSYEQTRTSFLEIKERHANGRTVKVRTSVKSPSVTSPWLPLDPGCAAFVGQVPTHRQGLEAKLWVNYRRITLVGRDRPERVTLDLDLQFLLPAERCTPGPAVWDAPDLVVVELKRASRRQPSPLEVYVRAQGYRPGGFSKYGVGCSLLHDLKGNAFKPQLLAVERLHRLDAGTSLGRSA